MASAGSLLLVSLAILLLPRTGIRNFDLGSGEQLGWPAIARARLVEIFGQVRRKRAEDDTATAWAMSIAGDLRAGTEPNTALGNASGRLHFADRAAAAVRVGGDVSSALALDAEIADDQLLRSVAACWSVGESTGSALAAIIEGIVDGHRESMSVRRSLAVELAGPKTTARLMTLLPVMGLFLAWVLGVNPLAWFFSSLIGWVALLGGMGLNVLGAVWTRALVAEVEALV
jgi:tight adherence protein B